MFVTEEGGVLGSINVAELRRLVADGTVDVDKLELAHRALLDEPADEPVADEAAADESEDLSKLHKADLVERAEAAGYDTAGMTKAELLEVLEADDQEGDA